MQPKSIDRVAQRELKARAERAKKGDTWNSLKHGAYDPEAKLRRRWQQTHIDRRERLKARRVATGQDVLVPVLEGWDDASDL